MPQENKMCTLVILKTNIGTRTKKIEKGINMDVKCMWLYE